MASQSNDEPAKLRDLANQARRLARGLSTADDVDRLKRYADELEAHALALEQRALKGG